MNKSELVVSREYSKEVKTMYYHTKPVGVRRLDSSVEELNKAILADFYAAVEWL